MRVETSAARHAREPGNTCWQCCSPPSPRLRRFLATRCATCRNQRHSDCYVDGRRVRFVDVTSYALKRGGAGKGRQGPRRRGSAPSSVCHFVWRGHYITTPVFEFSRTLIRNLARVLLVASRVTVSSVNQASRIDCRWSPESCAKTPAGLRGRGREA